MKVAEGDGLLTIRVTSTVPPAGTARADGMTVMSRASSITTPPPVAYETEDCQELRIITAATKTVCEITKTVRECIFTMCCPAQALT